MSVEKVRVRNNSTHEVGYTIVNSGLTRTFLPGQVMPLKTEEVEEALYQPGVMVLFTAGLLAIDSLEERIACGLAMEDEGEIIHDVVSKFSEKDLLAALQSDKLYDLVMVLKEATETEKSAIVDLALKHEIIDVKKSNEIQKYTGVDVIEVYQNRKKLDEITKE